MTGVQTCALPISDDHAHVFRGDLGDDVLQTAAFALRKLAAHAGHAAGWHEHQEA